MQNPQTRTIVAAIAGISGGVLLGISANTGVPANVSVLALVVGLVLSSVIVIFMLGHVWHVRWWMSVIAIAMTFVLSLVACRATGETDTTPTGAMGKVMQLLFAVLSPGNVTHNLMSAGAGVERTATRVSFGTTSLSNCSRLALSSTFMSERPVMFPPGRAKFATKPDPTGSLTMAMTIGMVVVAFFKDCVATVESATITSTLPWTSSATSSGTRS
jgi:hypothetical protein